MKFLLLLLVPLFIIPVFAQENSQTLPTDRGTLDVKLTHLDIMPNQENKLRIDFINPQTQKIQEHIDYNVTVSTGDKEVFGLAQLTHTSGGSVSIPVNFAEEGMYEVNVEVEGILFQPIPLENVLFGIAVGDTVGDATGDTTGDTTSDTMNDTEMQPQNDNGGGCLIATATFGSELTPQVQQLRELRDGTILGTTSGMAFISYFNQIYYSFSPEIADLQREQPIFREAVKVALVPMLSSLTLLDYVDINSEYEMLGYGISIITLNIGMYVGIPIFGAITIYRKIQKK